MTRTQAGPTPRDRIIRASTVLFARQGYYQTGTREIARLAGISEVTLFRYFGHKEDIFAAALHAAFTSIESRLNIFGRGVEERAPEEILPRIVNLLVDITAYSPELLKLTGVAVMELRGKYRDMCVQLMAPLLTAIATYLKLSIENGKLRNLNPAIVTAAMVLTIIVQPELSRIIEGCDLSRMNDRETQEAFSSFWLEILILPQLKDA
jgi:AcrR family transcriptional regulator